MILAYIDGGARGNPGPAGYGVRIESPDGTVIEELHGALGIATNNVAEYNGLLAALRWAVEHDARDFRIRRGMRMSLSGGLATMGSAVPYALAAKLQHPDRVVVALAGDGAMQMNGINALLDVAKY